MTLHSKAAINDVYDLFNQPLKCEAAKDDTQSGGESDFEEDGYSTAGESTGTGMISGVVSESGCEDTSVSVHTTLTTDENTSIDPADVGADWTEFSTGKHVPAMHLKIPTESQETNISQSVNDPSVSMPVEGFASPEEELRTPIEPEFSRDGSKENTRFVPIPPEDYEPAPLRPYRDPSNVAQSRLPFMTPIVEKTESSLAANTNYQKDQRDYFNSKTPSRTSPNNNDSPSKLGVEKLLLGSPFAENVSPPRSGGRVRSIKRENPVSPSPKSKRVSRGVLEEEVDDLSSPRKKVLITRVQESPAKIKVNVIRTPTSPITVNDDDNFVKPALPTPKPAPSKVKTWTISDFQCNPTDPSIRNHILANADPPLSSYPGLFNHPDQPFGKYTQIQKYAKKVQDTKIKSSPRKPSNTSNEKATTQSISSTLSFPHASRVYAVKRQLGQGAFAPVYLVESYDPDRPLDNPSPSTQERQPFEAIKAECPPSQAVWEFHIIRTIRSRLSQSQRILASIITTHECHTFPDEAYLILDYCPQGTLLDLVNAIKADNARAGKPSDGAGLEEPLAMFFTVELLRTIEELWRVGILHGDLKGDNCLLRLPAAGIAQLGPYCRDGGDGWDGVGLKLIDFGRGIDVTDFSEKVGFVADWAAGPTDAPEIREARPWVWQVDAWGAAGVIHSLLFGRYIETVPVSSGLGKKRYKLKEGLKRYWQGAIWGECFETLLNPVLPASTRAEEVEKVLLAQVRRCREAMEEWLETEGERRGLRALVRRLEWLVTPSRRK